MNKEALLYEKQADDKVRCILCNHKCLIASNSTGICGVRKNIDGTLYSLNYDKIIARHMDPVEKKPLFHFLPGSKSYSIAAAGCNLKCSFCQNSDISQMPVDTGTIAGKNISPEALVEEAVAGNAETIAYTYTEPTIYYELAKETAQLAKSRGLKNIFVSNGFMSNECLLDMADFLDGANIDLKSFSDDFYKKQCGARLEPVLETIKKLNDMGIWIEVTTLVIPGLNDSEEELAKIAEFIAKTNYFIPWHISRFHPRYKMTDLNPTDSEKLVRARQIGYCAGLKYVYTGNLPGDDGENTYCHNCGNPLIGRAGFTIEFNNLKKDKCPMCKTRVPGLLFKRQP